MSNVDSKVEKGESQHLEIAPLSEQRFPSFTGEGDSDKGFGDDSKDVIAAKSQAAVDADALYVTEAEEKISKFGILLCLVAAVSGLLFGWDTGVISAALVNMREDLGHPLTDVQREWIATGTGVGALFGSMMGNLSDRIGRKWTLAIGDVWFVLGALLIATSYSLEQIIVGRIVLGFGVGIAAAICPLYISELSPTRLRGKLMCLNALAITGGQVLSYAVGAGMTFNGGWRVLFAISVVPAIGQAIFIHYMPESPRYDLQHGRVEAARKTLQIIYTGASDDVVELKLRALDEVVTISRNFQEKHNMLARLRMCLFVPKYSRPTFTACGLIFFQQFCGFNTLMYYSATIFAYAGFDNPTATGLIVACTNLFFTGVCMALLGRVGKRRILLCGQPGMIAGLALAAMAFHFMTEKTGGVLVEGTQYDTKWTSLMLGMMVFFIASYATGLGTIPWQSNEFHSLQMRGMGSSLLATVCWAANIVVSATFLTLMNKIGAAGAFGFYAGLSTVGLVFIYFCYPEPDGLSLEEVTGIFDGGFRSAIKVSKEIRAGKKDRLASARA